jgi:TPR repeat protein
MYNLGISYSIGEGVPKNLDQARYWLKKAADAGVDRAREVLEVLGDSSEQPQAADPLQGLIQAANGGDPDAQYELGLRYVSGQGVEEDHVKALAWYKKAASGGNVQAMTNIGVIYQTGDGVEKNQSEAVKWFRQAADRGDQGALKALQVILAPLGAAAQPSPQSPGPKPPADEAEANFQMAVAYDFGYGVEEDHEKAARFYALAAEKDHPGAMYNLGLSYLWGEGVEKNRDQAVKWLTRASDRGQENARRKLAELGVTP